MTTQFLWFGLFSFVVPMILGWKLPFGPIKSCVGVLVAYWIFWLVLFWLKSDGNYVIYLLAIAPYIVLPGTFLVFLGMIIGISFRKNVR
jgi:hypothetical protein